MFFQILEVILWPKKSGLEPRRLIFKTDSINVISGVSKTGKSAIIPIIDYCLGSEKCTIPVNTIRDSCAWFGVLIQTINGQKLLARREPGEQKATGDMYVLEGMNIDIPHMIIENNTNVDNVKMSLDELVGLTTLDFDKSDSNSGFRSRPSFRDFTPFLFQPQNIVANPDIFFYKADTYEHREKMRTIFPYVLGAINPELLAKRHELNQLKKEIRRKANELKVITQVSMRWMAEINSRVGEAKELGLIKTPVPTNASKDQLFDLLEKIVNSPSIEIKVSSATISDSIAELINLQKEESLVSHQLTILRKRYSEMSELRSSAIQYQGTLQIQRDRLKISELFIPNKTDDNVKDCPICGNPMKSAHDDLCELYGALQNLENTAGVMNSIPAAFDREYERVREEMQQVSENLEGIRYRRIILEDKSEEAKKQQYESLRVARFIGNLEQSLQTYARIGTDSDLDMELQLLQTRVKELESEISEAQIQKRIELALSRVNMNAQRLLPGLDTEHPNDPAILSIDDLSIKIKRDKREDYLWEIGSGSNWLAYHVAFTLGLQQFFLELRNNPIPNFIIYDQPSQVYFPKILTIKNGEVESEPVFNDEDIIAIRKVFIVLSDVVQKNNLQIIVLDHAPESVWRDIIKVNFVEEWRDGKKLIPESWLN